MQEFFISYNKADREWAEWIAWTLEARGYTTIIQAWDFRPGENFVLRMGTAMNESARTIAVLSKDYLAALFTQSEWTAAFQSDPTGEQRKLIPVRVHPCELPHPYTMIIYCDLVGLSDPQAASDALINAVREENRLKPASPPKFPGASAPMPTWDPQVSRAVQERPEVLAAKELLTTLETTYTTFLSQAAIRNDLYDMMKERLGVAGDLEYEDFFSFYFAQMNEEERRLHETIRSYTIHVLREYNGRALTIAEQYPVLKQHIPRMQELERHLVIWKAKYEGVFLSTPSMSLCYVGVRENVPFPHGIEDELREYLQQPTT